MRHEAEALNRALALALADALGGTAEAPYGDHYFEVTAPGIRLGVSCQSRKDIRVCSNPSREYRAFRAYDAVQPEANTGFATVEKDAAAAARRILRRIEEDARADYAACAAHIEREDAHTRKTAATQAALGLSDEDMRGGTAYVSGTAVRISGDQVYLDRVDCSADQARRILAILAETE